MIRPPKISRIKTRAVNLDNQNFDGSLIDRLSQPIISQEKKDSLKDGLENLTIKTPSKTGINGLSLSFALVGTSLKLVKILSSDLKRMIKESNKDQRDSTSAIRSRMGRKLNPKQRFNKIDYQLARYLKRNQPLTKNLKKRLLYLETIGAVKFEDLKTRADVGRAIKKNKDKLSITKFDCAIVKHLQSGKFEEAFKKTKRIEHLIKDGFLEGPEKILSPEDLRSIKITERFQVIRRDLIERGLLDDRYRELVQIKSNGRSLKRWLPKEQIEAIKHLRYFSNLTESQLHTLYWNPDTRPYFKSDIQEMMKKNLLDFEKRTINNKEIRLYHLKQSGNAIGEIFTGPHNISKKYTKNDSELLHDLIQFEAYRIKKREILGQGGTIENIVTDRSKRSSIYHKNFKDIGDENMEKIIDLEIQWRDNQNQIQKELIEIDRGYEASVIQKKSKNFTKISWFTDNPTQAEKIEQNVKKEDKIYLLT